MKISRDELYRRVWETPVRTLAKEFDISDVGLAKVCRKNQIPLPPVGYWTKVQHGKRVSRPPLAKSAIDEITFDAKRNRPNSPNLGQDAPKLPAVQVELPTSTENLASFAAATLNHLKKAKVDERGMVTSQGVGVFDCCISVASAERVAKLLHAVEIALTVVDCRLVRGKEQQLLSVEHQGQSVRFAILEKYNRTEHLVKHKQYSWKDERHFTYTLSGRLTLQIEGYFEGRKSWSDGVRSTLEEKLSSIVTGLAMAAMAIKQRAVDAELRRQRWQEEARQREERERIRRDEEEFRRMLLVESQAWSDCQTTIAYLARIRQELGKATTEPSAAGLDWMDRAENAVRKADPLFRRVRSLKRQETVAIEGAGCGAVEVPLQFDSAAPFFSESI